MNRFGQKQATENNKAKTRKSIMNPTHCVARLYVLRGYKIRNTRPEFRYQHSKLVGIFGSTISDGSEGQRRELRPVFERQVREEQDLYSRSTL